MMNILLFCEVVNLHQRDVENEVGLRQIANQAKIEKIARPETIKRFILASFSSNQDGRAAKLREVCPR